MRRLTTLIALTAVALLALSGVAFATAEVTIGDDGLDPESVQVDVRESIVWTNASDADVSLVGTEPGWESGPIEPGATFQIKITEKGTYEYASADGSLAGEIVVGQTDGEGGDPEGEDVKTEDDKKDGTGEGGNKGGSQGNEESLPETGMDVTLPGSLSVLLIALGAALLLVARPARRLS